MAFNTKQTGAKRFGTSNVIDQSVLESLMCHFNWDLCTNIMQATLLERIDALQDYLEKCNRDLYPQSYSLLGYLKSLQRPLKTTVEQEVSQLFSKARECLPNLEFNKEKTKKGLGNKAVVIASSLIWKLHLRQEKEALSLLNEYQEICSEYKEIKNHPEALAMKGFAFGHCSSFRNALVSVEAYTRALSDEKYKNHLEWLFGLASSKERLSYKRDPPSLEDLSEIEKIWHMVIQISPKFSLAMLRLARTLWRLHHGKAIEEIEYWIETALEEDDKTVSVLEEAAFLYLSITRRKVDYIDKALTLFKKAETLNPRSKKTLEGLATAYLKRFYKNKAKYSHKSNVPKELNLAMENFEKSAENKTHYDRLRLANVYFEVSRFRGHDDFRDKAEDTFKEVIEEVENEDNPLRLAQAYVEYAAFLGKTKRQKDKIHFLRRVADIPIHDENLDKNEMRYVCQSQAQLLEYASKVQSAPYLFELKGFVQRKMQNFHSAIFYLEKAINNPDPGWTESYKTTLKENLVETLIEASKLNLANYLCAMPGHWIEEAEKKIEKLTDTPRKFDLKFEVVEIRTNTLMTHEVLRKLKGHRLKFEQVVLDINKQNLKSINSSLSEAEIFQKEEREKKETELCLDIISEGKCVLDRAIGVIKDNFFPSVNTLCYYPTPKSIKSQSESDLLKQMINHLEKRLKLKNFETKLPDLLKFLLKKQPNPATNEFGWLQDFFDIRNKLTHKVGAEELLKKKFPSREDRKRLVDNISLYAAEVWNRFQLEINNRERKFES